MEHWFHMLAPATGGWDEPWRAAYDSWRGLVTEIARETWYMRPPTLPLCLAPADVDAVKSAVAVLRERTSVYDVANSAHAKVAARNRAQEAIDDLEKILNGGTATLKGAFGLMLHLRNDGDRLSSLDRVLMVKLKGTFCFAPIDSRQSVVDGYDIRELRKVYVMRGTSRETVEKWYEDRCASYNKPPDSVVEDITRAEREFLSKRRNLKNKEESAKTLSDKVAQLASFDELATDAELGFGEGRPRPAKPGERKARAKHVSLPAEGAAPEVTTIPSHHDEKKEGEEEEDTLAASAEPKRQRLASGEETVVVLFEAPGWAVTPAGAGAGARKT